MTEKGDTDNAADLIRDVVAIGPCRPAGAAASYYPSASPARTAIAAPSPKATNTSRRRADILNPGESYACYSRQADEMLGHVVWLNRDGEEVEVTSCGYLTSACEGNGWPDKVCVGIVTSFVRSCKKERPSASRRRR